MSAPVVIIGTGLAGYNPRGVPQAGPADAAVADHRRRRSFYSKPLLSTGFAANKDADSLGMATAGAMAEQLNAEIRTHTRVTRLDPAHRRVWIGNEPVPYRDLVLAGARKRSVCRWRAMRRMRSIRSTTCTTMDASVPLPPANAAC